MDKGIEITKVQEYKIEKMLKDTMKTYSGRISHEYFRISKSDFCGDVYVTLISIVSLVVTKSVLTQSFTVGSRGKIKNEKWELN